MKIFSEAVSPRESLESRASPGASPSDGPHSGRGSPLGDGHLHSSGSKKARKARTIFTDKQLQELESTFEKQKYLSVQVRLFFKFRKSHRISGQDGTRSEDGPYRYASQDVVPK